MSPDDRFLPQGKQIFPKLCQVRPMPLTENFPNILQFILVGLATDLVK